MLKVSECKRVSCEIIAQVFYFLVFPHDKDNPRSAHVRTGGYLCRWDYNPVGVGEDQHSQLTAAAAPWVPGVWGARLRIPGHPRSPEGGASRLPLAGRLTAWWSPLGLRSPLPSSAWAPKHGGDETQGFFWRP